ncbi:MAG: zinc metallopeptidase [Parasulfuritortus sp.]|nr:zinc metallopeptidase [Parasulfuritortus sp.]
MRLDDERESSNVEDRRGGGFGGGLPIGGRHIGVGTVVIALVAWYFGINPSVVLNTVSGPAQTSQMQSAPPPANDEMAHFVGKVLAETEDTWQVIFKSEGKQYVDPKLVLYTGSTPTACGTGEAAMGPFYCPGDQKVYIDLAFYQELKDRFHAPGEFAEAYVIAHEVGHHVQNLLGISERVEREKQRVSEAVANKLSVKVELQADCLAGVWAANTDQRNHFLDPGDVEQAIAAATAIGDDRLQKEARGYVVPDSFTHGTSEQRVRWFRRGMESGKPGVCNTFTAASL